LLEHDSYGYEINKSIQESSGGAYELREATLYGVFRRLEENNYIKSYWGDEARGARRRYYQVTPAGREFYIKSIADWKQTIKLINLLIKSEGDHNE